MFQFHYAITDDDYIKFNLNHSLHAKIGKKTALINKLLLPCIFACITLITIRFRDIVFVVTELIFYSIASILWIVFYKEIILQNIKRNIRMLKKSGRLPYNENGTLTFEENFICETTTLQENKTAYNLVEAIYTTNEALYIYNSAISAIILPYRFIENQDVFNSLVNFLQEKTGKAIINITK